jgi:hypothetical protein
MLHGTGKLGANTTVIKHRCEVSITSTVSANTTSGFSIVTYTGGNTNWTVQILLVMV